LSDHRRLRVNVSSADLEDRIFSFAIRIASFAGFYGPRVYIRTPEEGKERPTTSSSLPDPVVASRILLGGKDVPHAGDQDPALQGTSTLWAGDPKIAHFSHTNVRREPGKNWFPLTDSRSQCLADLCLAGLALVRMFSIDIPGRRRCYERTQLLGDFVQVIKPFAQSFFTSRRSSIGSDKINVDF